MIPAPFDHQAETTQFLLDNRLALCTSSPGTGKTRAVLDAIKQLSGRVLVIAPKSILEPSWADDIKKFTPELTYAVAEAPSAKREAAFKSGARIVLINHDAVKWVMDHSILLEGFETLVVDESTAFKNAQSARSKACARIASSFTNRYLLTGTPNPNGIIDLWHQLFLIDAGARLGDSYWRFRSATHEPVARGPFTEWKEKEGATEAVFGLIQDINIRHKFEDCISIPANFTTLVEFDLDADHQNAYEELRKTACLATDTEEITALNAAVLANKLLQAASGTVYNNSGDAVFLDSVRYELILDLAAVRDQCLIAFNWAHQRDALVELANKRKISYGIIDGSVNKDARNKAIKDFQNGNLKLIFAHPQSAAHGLTLTKGTTTIWSSPVYNAEHYEQFCRRIYRAGQTKKTETIHIAARDTIDAKAYDRLTYKRLGMKELLELLEI